MCDLFDFPTGKSTRWGIYRFQKDPKSNDSPMKVRNIYIYIAQVAPAQVFHKRHTNRCEPWPPRRARPWAENVRLGLPGALLQRGLVMFEWPLWMTTTLPWLMPAAAVTTAPLPVARPTILRAMLVGNRRQLCGGTHGCTSVGSPPWSPAGGLAESKGFDRLS